MLMLMMRRRWSLLLLEHRDEILRRVLEVVADGAGIAQSRAS